MLPQLWVCAAASRARGTPVIGFWKASVSIAATGFVCPMALSAARSVDAGRVADFRQSYTQKSSGQAEPFLFRVGEANGNFIKANSRLTKAIGCYQGRPTPKCLFYKQLPVRRGGGPAAGGGARAPPRAANPMAVLSSAMAALSRPTAALSRPYKATMAALSRLSGRNGRFINRKWPNGQIFGFGLRMADCPVQAVYQRPGRAFFSKGWESERPLIKAAVAMVSKPIAVLPRPASPSGRFFNTGRFIKAGQSNGLIKAL